mmetsp:Transcript_74264/g.172273  ORF Transcript_74264/g.172273 Transcript_74264/m.172273 type:complete len:233 (+) Transcript_74264:447-1145(+)
MHPVLDQGHEWQERLLPRQLHQGLEPHPRCHHGSADRQVPQDGNRGQEPLCCFLRPGLRYQPHQGCSGCGEALGERNPGDRQLQAQLGAVPRLGPHLRVEEDRPIGAAQGGDQARQEPAEEPHGGVLVDPLRDAGPDGREGPFSGEGPDGILGQLLAPQERDGDLRGSEGLLPAGSRRHRQQRRQHCSWLRHHPRHHHTADLPYVPKARGALRGHPHAQPARSAPSADEREV